MPAIVREGQQKQSGLREIDFGYQYPDGLNLRPGYELHDKLVTRLMQWVEESAKNMSAKHGSWRKIDHTLNAYIPLDEEEKRIKAKDERKPVSVVVPMSAAILESLLTYWMESLLSGTIWQYDGMGPEDRYAAIMCEKLIEFQSVRFRHALSLYYQARDAFAYGFGVLVPQWERETAYVRQQVPWMLGPIKLGMKTVEYDKVLKEGTKLKNIQPWHYFPDPNVPIHEPQSGQFVAWAQRDNIATLLDEEKAGRGFNALYCKRMKPCTSTIYESANSGRYDRDDVQTENQETDPVDRITICARVIPKDLGIGESAYPEKWVFQIAGDAVLTNMYRLTYEHGMFPVSVLAPDTDGYAVAPVSRLESIYGLQVYLDFLLNTHAVYQRKVSTGMLIADPLKVHIPSLEDSDAGRIIYLDEAAWGQGISDAVGQLRWDDVTGRNISDAWFIIDMMQRVSAAVDTVQGVMKDKSESPTATEVGSARQSALSRLQKMAKIGALQSYYDIAMMCAHNVQQFYSAAQYIEISGRWETTLRNEYGVMDPYLFCDPAVFQVSRDIIPHNGALPGAANLNGLLQWFQMVATNPITVAGFDINRLATHVGRELGVADAEAFRLINPVVMPNEQVSAGVQAGDLVPVDSAHNEGGVF